MSKNSEENSIKTNLTSWIICILLIVCILFVSVITFAKKSGNGNVNRASSSDATDTDADEDGELVTDAPPKQITVNWQGKEYTGMYSGSLKNDKPSGEGTFVSDDEKLTYHGDWMMGMFHGDGKITYIDGSYETGSYDSGKRHGRIKEYKDDDNYSVARYNEDIRYGERIYYENEKETDSKWYYKGKSLAKREKKAIELTRQVFEDKDYIDKTIYIEGTVVFAGETSKSEYFRIETESMGMVTGHYSNSLGKYLKQPNLPTMKKGDKVKIYGTISDVEKNYCVADEEAFGYDYPEIKPISGYILDDAPEADDSTETDAKKLSDEYMETLRYPFSHYTRWISEKYLVTDVLRSGKKVYLFASVKGESKDELYVLFFNADENAVFKEGDTLKVSGYRDGQYKKVSSKDKEAYEKQTGRTKVLKDKYSGLKIDLDQAVFTYDYEMYPAVHVYKWKKQ